MRQRGYADWDEILQSFVLQTGQSTEELFCEVVQSLNEQLQNPKHERILLFVTPGLRELEYV
ncbi:MAG: hypothetical protein ACYTXY_23850 [Nostoc sp.]